MCSLRIVFLPGLCVLDVCWRILGFCVFDVNRTRRAALYVGLYVQSRVVILPGLCALDVCWPCLGCARSTLIEPAVLPCTWAYMCSLRIVLLSGLCSCWLCVCLLSLWLYLVDMLLPQVVRALDVY